MDEKSNVGKSHKVLLANRKTGAFSGVVDVLSFDVSEILLETELGMLLIKGHDLHVNRLSLEKGERVQLQAVVYPENATDKSVIWTSSDTSVADVDKNGMVSAISYGTATITAS